MKKVNGFYMTAVAGAALLGVTFSGMAIASPPSRQTPVVVAKDKQGVIEVGPCQMPPAVGAKVCTPNARDYGYFEGTWREWPTQKRYDKTFPQAIGSTPISPYASRPVKEPALAPTAPVAQPAASEKSFSLPDVNTLIPQQEATGPKTEDGGILEEIVPSLGVPQGNTPDAPAAPAASVVPTTPGPETTIMPDLFNSKTPSEPAKSAEPAPQVVEPTPMPKVTPDPAAPATPIKMAPTSEAPMAPISPAPMPGTDSPAPIPKVEPAAPSEEELVPPLDTPNVNKGLLPLPTAPSVPGANGLPVIPESKTKEPEISTMPDLDDIEETAKDPSNDFSQMQVPSVPEYQIPLVPDAEPDIPEYNAQLVQAPVTVQPAMTIQSAEEVSIPASWEEKEVAINAGQPVAQAAYDAPNTSFAESNITSVAANLGAVPGNRLGLDGFCPVTLLSSENWVEGDSRWSVLHHGVTYYLASPEMDQLFLSNPDKYVPVLDGKDPVEMIDKRADVQGKTDYCVVFEGKLYMFGTEAAMNMFFENTAKYR